MMTSNKCMAACWLLASTVGAQDITASELASHNSATDCWMAINGEVWEVTNWANNHPGGKDNIINNCGTDHSAGYNANPVHPSSPSGYADSYIGTYCCGSDGGGDSMFGSLTCFSEVATLQVLNKGPVPMKEIQVGDRVLTASNHYLPVYAFAHLETTKKAEFLQIYTSKFSKTPLEVTPSHLVFLEGKRNPVRADSIQVGDVLGTTQAGATVTKISAVTRNGLYAPLTPDSTLIVDGIKASNYISLQDSAVEYVQLQHGFTAISQHDGLHLSFAPFRMICTMGIAHNFCHSYGKESGMPGFVAGGVNLARWVDSLDLNIVLQFVLLVAYITLYMAPFVLLELALHLIWSYGSLAVLVGATLVIASKVVGVQVSAKKMKAV